VSLLLDTHSFLWFVLNDPLLPKSARDLIETSTSIVYVSPTSYWEIAVKIGCGKYSLHTPFEVFWETGIRISKVSVLAIKIEHAAQLTSLPFHHRDPFDRMLVARSLVEDLTLVSKDSRLDAYGVRRAW